MQKILLVDFAFIGEHGGGHSEAYLMKLLSILTSNGYYVYLCSGADRKLDENIRKRKLKNCQTLALNLKISDKIVRRFLLGFDAFLSRIDKLIYCRFASLINMMSLKRIISDLGEDIPVFLAYTDSMMPEVPTAISKFLMPGKWVGLHVCPSYQSKLQFGTCKSRRLFNAEKNFALSSCKAILVLHPTYQRFFAKRFSQLNCIYLPELVEIEESKADETSDVAEQVNWDLLKQIRAKAKGRKVISMLGNITPRKSLLLFLDATSNIDASQCFVIVLGRLKGFSDAQYQLEMDKINFYRNKLNDNAFIDVNYYITSEREFYELIQMSDIIFLHYNNHPFSSNVLAKSMAFRKPVIASKGHLMEKTLNKYGWPLAVESDAYRIAQAIEILIDSEFKIAEENYLAFTDNHSSKIFETAVLQACESLKN